MKRLPYLTLALIIISVAVALHSSFGSAEDALKALFFASPGHTGLEEIESGQVWRLVTPIFIHFGLLHLFFNMMWTWDLGREVEARRGRWFLGGFVVAIGVAGNVAQYVATGPSFGGMSGVVYGLLAYVWIRNRVDPTARYVLHRYDVVTCVGWYVLCWTGLLGPIANWSHTVGLIGGLTWGYLETAAVPGGRFTRPWFYIVLGCGIGAAAVLVLTQYQGRWLGCAGEEAPTPDQQIAACSKILESTTASTQTRSHAFVDRGAAYRAQSRNDLAISDYNEAIALDPDNAGALAARGLAERDAGQTARGKADIDRARQIDRGVDRAYPALHYYAMTDEALAGIDLQDADAIDTAMRSVVRRVLAEMPAAAPDEETPNARFFSFRTDVPGVGMSNTLRATYPKEMTLVLQYQYRDLVVTPQTISVTASFHGDWEAITVPLKAMTSFQDETAKFKIAFRDVDPQ